MNEIFFIAEDSTEGGYEARALEHSIFTEAETLDELRSQIRKAVQCHFDEKDRPEMIRGHFVKEEVFAVQSS